MEIEEMEYVKNNLNSINIDMVELHCFLCKNQIELDEIYKACNMYNKLNCEFTSLKEYFESYVNDINNNLEIKTKKYSKKTKYYTAFAIIPGIGLFIALLLVLKYYNKILALRIAKRELDRFSDEVSPNIKIISEMLERKELLINKKFNELDNKDHYNDLLLSRDKKNDDNILKLKK